MPRLRTAHLALVAASLWLGMAAPALAQASDTPWRGETILDDPEWRKRFFGSYGTLSDLEPQLPEIERPALTEALGLMGDDPKAASERLRQAIGRDTSAALDYAYANLQFQNGETESAIRAYRRALKKFPDFRRAHKNLALLLVQETRCGDALPHLTRAVELGERDGRNYGLLGYCYASIENQLAAEEAYRNAILQEPNSMDWQLGLARALLATEQYREAVALFDSLIARDPDDANLWLLQANAYLGREQPDRAIANLEAVRLMGGAKPSALVLLGDIYMNEGIPELAKSAYLDVIEKDEKATEFKTAVRAADLLVRTQSWSDAKDVLNVISRQYPELSSEDEIRVLTLRAAVAKGQGKAGEAAKLYETIVSRDGTQGKALLALADHHRAAGDDERALLMLERAGRLEDFEHSALLKQAQIRVTQRKYPEAAQLLRSALEIKNEPRVARFLARVEEVTR
ncbi:MAG: tetratricopeptide repeat protein [Myxococcota bacterium]|nr:tetratricopeptide repeat protein [Myxococcota bacterium]